VSLSLSLPFVVVVVVVVAIVDGGWRVYENREKHEIEHETARHSEWRALDHNCWWAFPNLVQAFNEENFSYSGGGG
jgi:hypothetical protein